MAAILDLVKPLFKPIRGLETHKVWHTFEGQVVLTKKDQELKLRIQAPVSILDSKISVE